MLLHHYLKEKEEILLHAERKIKNLLSDIAEVNTRAAVEAWKLGDSIPSDYPQQEAKATTGDDLAKAPEMDSQPSQPEENEPVVDIAYNTAPIAQADPANPPA